MNALSVAARNVQDGKYLGFMPLHSTKCVLCISFSTTFPISSCVSFPFLSFGPLQNSFIIKFISSYKVANNLKKHIAWVGIACATSLMKIFSSY